jgi:feruloyl esterase
VAELVRGVAHIGIVASILSVPSVLAATCESLTSLALLDAKVTSAQIVPPPILVESRGHDIRVVNRFCRVSITLTPTSDSDIKAEIWLPDRKHWKGKFQGLGSGGFGGAISAASLAGALNRGYATAMSDTGHRGPDAQFGLNQPQKIADYGYRSTHVTALISKEIVAKYYGRPPRHAYFEGCLQGGRRP